MHSDRRFLLKSLAATGLAISGVGLGSVSMVTASGLERNCLVTRWQGAAYRSRCSPGYLMCLRVRQMAHTSTLAMPLSWSNRVS